MGDQKTRKISSIAKNGISKAKYSRLLYRIGQMLEPKIILELGTSLGINTLYLSASYPQAKVYTFEGCVETARLAQDLFKNWKLDNINLVQGNIDDTLPAWLKQVDRVDFAYIDANHRYQPTLDYFQGIHDKAHSESIIALDDIYWSAGMARAWQHIKSQDEVSLSLDFFELGIVLFQDLQIKQHYDLMY